MLKKNFIFCLLLSAIGFFNPACATFGFLSNHPTQNVEIDSLIEVARTVYSNEEYKESLQIYNSIVKLSEEKNYSEGKVIGYLGISGVFYNIGKLDVSTSYLIKAREESYAKNNPNILYSISVREGLNLHTIGLYDEALKKYRESLKIASKLNDKEDRIDKSYSVYINIGDLYQLKKQNDSALYFYKTAYNSSTRDLLNKFVSSASISELYSEKGQLDSAYTYLDYSKYYSRKLGTTYAAALYKEMKGKYLIAKQEYNLAIESLESSVELNHSIHRSNPQLFRLLSEVNQKLGKEEVSTAYLKKYVHTKDSLESIRKQNLKVPILLAEIDAEHRLEKAESHTKMIAFILLLLLAIISSLAYYFIKKQKRKGLRGKKENHNLKKKLNNAFDEVVELAETNSPNFLSRFIEVYPEFYNQLITEYPKLTTADVRLCALMKLDFSTKEIAEITFSSLRTVQNRMYKLRKKFNLSTDEKLNRFIQSFHIETLTVKS